MIKIITGEMNDLKTTRMIEHYETSRLGDGFAALKTMMGDQIHSFTAMRLSTGEKAPLAIHDNYAIPVVDAACRVGPYQFYRDTMAWIEETVLDLIEAHVEPIYLDEIGALEMGGSGFDSVLRQMLKSGLDLVLVVRMDLLKRVIDHYNLNPHTIILP